MMVLYLLLRGYTKDRMFVNLKAERYATLNPLPTGLHSLKEQHFKKFAIIMNRHTPFFIMVIEVLLTG
jgi:hypothetical protein